MGGRAGSELDLAVKAAKELGKDGTPVSVVSMPCWELFEKQSKEYQLQVFPPGVSTPFLPSRPRPPPHRPLRPAPLRWHRPILRWLWRLRVGCVPTALQPLACAPQQLPLAAAAGRRRSRPARA